MLKKLKIERENKKTSFINIRNRYSHDINESYDPSVFNYEESLIIENFLNNKEYDDDVLEEMTEKYKPHKNFVTYISNNIPNLKENDTFIIKEYKKTKFDPRNLSRNILEFHLDSNHNGFIIEDNTFLLPKNSAFKVKKISELQSKEGLFTITECKSLKI